MPPTPPAATATADRSTLEFLRARFAREYTESVTGKATKKACSAPRVVVGFWPLRGENAADRSMGMSTRTCLNTVTIKYAALEQKIEVAADTGFDAVGLWNTDVSDYLQSGHTLGDLQRMLSDAQLHVAEMCAAFGWQYVGKAEQKKALDEARWKLEQCAELQAGCIIAPGSREEGDLRRAADDFVALCEVAAEFGIRVAFEFIWAHKQFHDVAAAWQLILQAGQDNGGLVVDTHHFYLGDSTLGDLAAGPPEKVFLVHASDAPDGPKGELTYKDRIHVGTGAIPLREILGTLREMGCTCPISLEIFNENYWSADPKRVAAEAKDRLANLLSDTGYGG